MNTPTYTIRKYSESISRFLFYFTSTSQFVNANVTPPRSLITGHRGASSVAPENTLSAFRTAWEIGCDAIEGDFRLTRDGIIVCIHDSNTQRTTGIHKEISEVSFSSLQELDFGAWKDTRFVGEACPTIDEVLATVPPQRHIFIELKTGPEIIQPLKTSLHKSSLLREQIILITFDRETAKQCKRFLQNIGFIT